MQLNVGAILPYLLKKKVLMAEEEREINQLAPDDQAQRLVAMVGRKGMRTIAAFVECLKQSRENERLSHLFDVAQSELSCNIVKILSTPFTLSLLLPLARRMAPKSSTEKTSMCFSSLFNTHLSLSLSLSLPPSLSLSAGRLAVLVSMDTFLWLKNDYVAEEKHMKTYSKDFEDQR